MILNGPYVRSDICHVTVFYHDTGQFCAGYRCIRLLALSPCEPRLPMSTSLATEILKIHDISKINLALAVHHASKSSKEAPWYGAWMLFLQQLDDHVFHGNQLGITTSVFFPQHPLTATIADLDEIIDPPVSHPLDDDGMGDESDPEEGSGPEIGSVSPNAGVRDIGMKRIDETSMSSQ